MYWAVLVLFGPTFRLTRVVSQPRQTRVSLDSSKARAHTLKYQSSVSQSLSRLFWRVVCSAICEKRVAMSSKPVPVQVRRIVTGHNAAGRSYIESDGPAPAVMRPAGQPNVMSNDVWRTFQTPAKIDAPDPTVQEGYKCELKPPENGNVFRVL
jgi:hypothetical protein